MNEQTVKKSLKESIIEKMFRKNIINSVCQKDKIYKIIREDLIPFVDTEVLETSADETEDTVRLTFGELGHIDMKFVWEFMRSYDISGDMTVMDAYKFFSNIAHSIDKSIDIMVTHNYNNDGTNVHINTSDCGRIRITILPDKTVNGFINECRNIDKLIACLSRHTEIFSNVDFREQDDGNACLELKFVSEEAMTLMFTEKSSSISKIKNIL